MRFKIKECINQRKTIFFLLIAIFSIVESYLVLSHSQFGNSIGAYQFKYVHWDEKTNNYCYTYKNTKYRRVRIWSKEKKKSDFYRVIMPNSEELLICQSDRRIILPAREGITDFDNYKKVLEKENYNILKRIIDNKYNNPLPQNILFILFVTALNALFSAMILFPEKVRIYQKVVSNTNIEKKEKPKIIYIKYYQIFGIVCMFIILYSCF